MTWLIPMVCLIVLIVFLAFRFLARPDLEKNRGAALQMLLDQIPPEFKDLGALVVANFREYRSNTVRWSAAYFGCIFGSAFMSALAGVFLKLESVTGTLDLKRDLAATFSALAALLITLSTVGDFQRKWEANRIASSAMENLAYEFLKPEQAIDRKAIIEKIQEVNEARTASLVGQAARSPGTSPRPKPGAPTETSPSPHAKPSPPKEGA